MTVLTTPDCQRWFGAYIDDDMHYCAFDLQTDKTFCNGDTGGPLNCRASSGDWQVNGVLSWGVGGCDAAYPTVFTRLSKHCAWLSQETAGDVTCSQNEFDLL